MMVVSWEPISGRTRGDVSGRGASPSRCFTGRNGCAGEGTKDARNLGSLLFLGRTTARVLVAASSLSGRGEGFVAAAASTGAREAGGLPLPAASAVAIRGKSDSPCGCSTGSLWEELRDFFLDKPKAFFVPRTLMVGVVFVVTCAGVAVFNTNYSQIFSQSSARANLMKASGLRTRVSKEAREL
jgi:hypothetical protein